jgi:hypothetical protein
MSRSAPACCALSRAARASASAGARSAGSIQTMALAVILVWAWTMAAIRTLCSSARPTTLHRLGSHHPHPRHSSVSLPRPASRPQATPRVAIVFSLYLLYLAVGE